MSLENGHSELLKTLYTCLLDVDRKLMGAVKEAAETSLCVSGTGHIRELDRVPRRKGFTSGSKQMKSL